MRLEDLRLSPGNQGSLYKKGVIVYVYVGNPTMYASNGDPLQLDRELYPGYGVPAGTEYFTKQHQIFQARITGGKRRCGRGGEILKIPVCITHADPDAYDTMFPASSYQRMTQDFKYITNKLAEDGVTYETCDLSPFEDRIGDETCLYLHTQQHSPDGIVTITDFGATCIGRKGVFEPR